MRITATLFILCLSCLSWAQNFKEKELKTEIKEVTVFLQGAQIFETGSVSIPSGKTILKIKNLSPFIDEKSIQVKAKGDFTILSVNHKLNHLNELKKDAKIDSLKKQVEIIEGLLAKENARLEVLSEKQSLLNQNKSFGGQNTGITMAQLKQAMDFYETEISKIKEEEIKVRKLIASRKLDQSRLMSQLTEVHNQSMLPSSEIEVRVSAEAQLNATFQVTYIVSNAGWFPKYDVRVQDVKNPLEIIYKAEVYQHTGVDWNNVKLRFSNGDPNQSGVIPELKPWNLNFARFTILEKSAYGTMASLSNVKGRIVDSKGSPLPGINIIIRGTSIGTVSDLNGRYNLTLPNGATQLQFSGVGFITQTVTIDRPEINVRLEEDIQQLSEIVVTAYGASRDKLQGRVAGVQIRETSSLAKTISTTVVENQTTIEIEVAIPYSIKSNGEKMLVDLKKLSMEALYEYYAIPKLDKDAFLVARLINWDQYNLLEGEANLYFEDAYVGRTILEAKSLQDTLTISLGRDKNIVVGRERVEQFTKKKSIGTNMVESRGFKIVVRNKKSLPIKLTLFDQLPVSVTNEITVNSYDISKGKLDEKTGRITWELQLDPQQQKELNFQYEVKYPKKEKVLLE